MDERVTDEDGGGERAGRADRWIPGRILCAADGDGDDHLGSGSTVVPDPVLPLSAISLCLSLRLH